MDTNIEQANSQTINQDMSASILYDGSASMKGFFPQGIIQLNKKLIDILSSVHINADSQVFVSNNTNTKFYFLNDFINTPKWGTHTKLDDALSSISGKDLVVFVTDNINRVEMGC